MTRTFTGRTQTEANGDLDLVARRLLNLDFGDPRRQPTYVGDGVANDAAAIAATDFDVIAMGGFLMFPAGTTRIGTDTTISADMFGVRGALVSVDAGKTLTVNGSIPLWVTWQIFTGAGNVRFGSGTTVFRPEWFGVVMDDGLRAYDPATRDAYKTQCIANTAAFQKLLDALPGAGSTDPNQMNRLKTVVFRPGVYGFFGTASTKNRRITFCPDGSGAEFATVIALYSNSGDPGGANVAPWFHLEGNPGTAPLFLDVSGEVTFFGLRFIGAPEFTLTSPVIQIGGIQYSATSFLADGANPVTGCRIIHCGFAEVYSPVRFTYGGDHRFTDCLVDAAYFGVMMTHATQEITISFNRFNAVFFYTFYLVALGLPNNAQGDPVPKPICLRIIHNELSNGADYAGETGGFTGPIQVDNDADNMLDGLEFFDNRCMCVGNKQDAVFGVDPLAAVLSLGFVKNVAIRRNRFVEWPLNTTHFSKFLDVRGAGSDYIYASDNDWSLALDDPATDKWYSMPDSVLHTNIPDIVTVTIDADARFNLPIGFQFGTVHVFDGGNGKSAVFLVQNASAPETAIMGESPGSGYYSTTFGTALHVNFAWNALLGCYQLENKNVVAHVFRLRLTFNAPFGTQ